MAGKKWCEYCRINLPYDKKVIQEHEATRQHIHNQQKSIKFQRIKIQRQEKAHKQAAKANSFTSTANIPKAKKGSQLDKEVQKYRDDVMMNGKMAIHQLIAERTKGLYGAPIQYPEKEDLVLAENYQDEKGSEDEQEEKFEMWRIDICEETGKPCFINRISKAVAYEPPKGYIMSEQQKQEWEETVKICQQVSQPNLEERGEAGDWEEVHEEQDFFKINQAHSSQNSQNSQNQDQQNKNKVDEQSKLKAEQYLKRQHSPIKQEQIKKEQIKKGWMEELQERVGRNQVTQQQVFGTMLTNTLQQCRSLKQKNEMLKKLVRNDFEIRATLAKDDEQLLAQELLAQKKNVGFKTRKMVKKCELTTEKDFI